MKFERLFGVGKGALAEYGRLTYAMGVEWGRKETRATGLVARVEGLIGQNPTRKDVSCTMPVKR